ncbi:MAG: chemotaxis response regulator protein-glutamate methylesterase [Clostridium sp.]|uniref:protein-glutamate methylesterase/protein-glutamine glutaminase n=1 Tax=Clostridium sp. TaxID=1506 RepID=UPI00302A1154
MTQKISVIVADDSALMRKIISDMINMEEDMEVIDIARNGLDLLEKLEKQVPDVITLDVEMPKMNGIEALKKIIELNLKAKVIMLSSLTGDGAEVTMECLAQGATDFVQKPSGSISLNINEVQDMLVSKIRGTKYIRKQDIKTTVKIDVVEKNSVSLAGISKLPNNKNSRTSIRTGSRNNIKNKMVSAVVIGASTGGPKALFNLITTLPGNLDVPIFVVQHMPAGFTKAFAERLNKFSEMKVVEATQGMRIEKNVVYVAPGGKHMEVDKNVISLNIEPSIWGVRPAVDKLFISASRVYKENILGVILTGMGKDGANGIVEIKKSGGITISEDESTCVIYGMPKAAYETNMVDEVIPLYDISKKITNIVLRM